MQENIKNKIIFYLIFLFMISMSLENFLSFEFFDLIRISVVEISFLFLFLTTLIFFYDKLYRYYRNYNNFNIFDYIFFFILFLKLIKICLNPSSINIYELLIWIYMILIFNLFNFLLTYNKQINDILNYSIICLSLLISIFVYLSLII